MKKADMTIQMLLIETLFKAFYAFQKNNNISFTVDDIHLEHPADEKRGDYASTVALSLWREQQSIFKQKEINSPLVLAQKIAGSIKSDLVKSVEVVAPGFINIFLSDDFLIHTVSQIISKKEDYGKSNIGKNQKLMVEYAHPNTHKLFHIGHLRNICLGESICRILEASGYKVYRTNYQGDVGMHIAKCLWAIQQLSDYERKLDGLKKTEDRVAFLGESYAVGSKAYESDEKAKEQINIINSQIYQADPSIEKLYQETRKWSLEYFDFIYKRLYTKFDRLYFEHEVWKRGQTIVLEYLKKGLFEKSEGAVIFPGEKYGLHNRVFINSMGLPTYEAKDIGLGELQLADYHADRYIHLVGPEQKGYFEVVFKALEQIKPELKGKEIHRSYGWVRLKEGKMSSRVGNVVTGESLLESAKERLSYNFSFENNTKSQDVLEDLAVGAVKYSMLKYAVETEFVFDVNESTSLEGNSGSYLQYTNARCVSVLVKGGEDMPIDIRIEDLEKLETSLLRTFYRFPEVVADAAEHLSPNIICNYLYELSQKFNLFYNEYPILKAEDRKRQQRLVLTRATSLILKNGLHLLGIKTPDKI